MMLVVLTLHGRHGWDFATPGIQSTILALTRVMVLWLQQNINSVDTLSYYFIHLISRCPMSIVMDERGALNSSFAPSEIRSTSNTPVLPNGPSTMTCKLCREPPVQPTYLNCKHVFCYMCLHAYVERNRYTDSLDFPCPHCSKLSAPPWGIWHLSHKVCTPLNSMLCALS